LAGAATHGVLCLSYFNADMLIATLRVRKAPARQARANGTFWDLCMAAQVLVQGVPTEAITLQRPYLVRALDFARVLVREGRCL
jgi:hypothetical protein